MEQHLVITGDLTGGLSFWGPFATASDAIEWAENELEGEWSVAPLSHPISGDPA